VRTDENLRSKTDGTWKERKKAPLTGIRPGEKIGSSFSGHERNKLFVSADALRFDDVSAVSGLDHPGDSRVASFLDLDRDGWQDIAMVNANAPLLQVFRNDIAAVSRQSNRSIAVRFVGGNDSAQPKPGSTPRDGVGAKAFVTVGDRVLLRERHCGEGFAAQNSATLLVGLGPREAADGVKVVWPNGTEQTTGPVPAGTLLTVYESPEQSPTGEAFVAAPYGPAISVPRHRQAALQTTQLPVSESQPDSRLRVYTTMATWCDNCKAEIPELEALRAVFDQKDVAMFGIPVDPKDTAEKLAAYAAERRPAYEILDGRSQETVDRVVGIGREALGKTGLPMTVVLDSEGHVRLVRWGTPTVSELRKLLL
jgi:thiol-disulfide isomerase/thioredoxin